MLPLVLAGSSVTLDQETFQRLLPPEPEPAEVAPGALVVGREVRLDRVGDERVDLRATWTVAVERPVGVALRLAGPGIVVEEVRVDGVEASAVSGPDGTTFSAVLRRDARIELRGSAPGNVGARVHLELLPAGAGVVDHPDGTVVEGAIRIGPGRSIGGGGDLWLGPAPVLGGGTGTMVVGEAGLGVTVGEAEVAVHGRLRWRITRGELATVGFTVPGAGPDLAVAGPQVASVNRSGDRVDVVLREPERSLVALDVRYTLVTPPGETASVPVPDVRLDPVFRTTSTLTVARDPQLDVVPAMPGWQPAAAFDLPDWGQSLVEGVPAAAFVGQGGGGALSVLRFTPADGPATLIDVASYTVALDADGAILMRAHYAVRNDRGAVLHLRPPPGLEPIGVRVGSDPAKLSRDGEVWRVPLEKSVETVEGLLSFPVEVLLLGRIEPWARREERELALPVVDAEIAVSRLTLHLPPGYRGRSRRGQGDVVKAFTEGAGITYGFAVGDVRAAQADQLFQAAVDAWMSNEFDAAGKALEDLEALGASSGDIGRLKSNLDLVEGKDDDGTGEMMLERRVLEQARVRALEDTRRQEEELKKAEQAYNSGDYDLAEEAYKNALDVGEDLAKLYNAEDKRQEALNSKVKQKLAGSVAVSQQKAANYSASQSVAAGEHRTGFDFEDVTIEGELVEPSGTPGGVEGGVVGGLPGAVLRGAVAVDPTSGAEAQQEEAEPADEALLAQDSGVLGVLGGDGVQEPALEPPRPVATVETTAGVAQTTQLRRPSVIPRINRGTGKPAPQSETATPAPEPLEPPVPPPDPAPASGRVATDFEEIPVSGRNFSARVGPVGDLPTTPLAPDSTSEMVEEEPADPIVTDGQLAEPARRNVERSQTRSGRWPSEVEPEVPAVTASALSVVVPNVGESVLYQHLLLPSGTAWVVPIDARERRNR